MRNMFFQSRLVFVILILISACAKPSLNDRLLGACATGNLSEIKKCLSQGADVNYKSHSLDASTPLIWAVRERQERAVTLLLESGADPNIPNGEGKTALFFAFDYRDNDSNIITSLILSGANTEEYKSLFESLPKSNPNRLAFENAVAHRYSQTNK
jgi:ankyrin repeat protein